MQRGADMDRRAILELHGHRRASLVVTDGRANLLQVGLADHLQRALAAVGEGPNPKQTQLRRRGALVGVAQGDGRQLRVAEASRVEGEHHREPPLATFELLKLRHPAAAGVLVHNVGERLVELQEGHTPVLPGLHPQRILKLPHDGLQDVARGPKARHLDAVAVAEDHLAHIMVVLFVVEVAPCVRDAKDLVQREVHLVVQEEAEVDAVVLLLNHSHDVVHLPNMHLVQLLDVKELVEATLRFQRGDEPVEALVPVEHFAPHFAVPLRGLPPRLRSLLVELGDAARAELRRRPLSGLVLRTRQPFLQRPLVVLGSFDLKSHLRLDVQLCLQLRLQRRHPRLALLDVFPQAHLFSIRLRET